MGTRLNWTTATARLPIELGVHGVPRNQSLLDELSRASDGGRGEYLYVYDAHTRGWWLACGCLGGRIVTPTCGRLVAVNDLEMCSHDEMLRNAMPGHGWMGRRVRSSIGVGSRAAMGRCVAMREDAVYIATARLMCCETFTREYMGVSKM